MPTRLPAPLFHPTNMTTRDVIDRLKRVETGLRQINIFDLLTEIVSENKNFILDLNRSQLFDLGIKFDDEPLTPGYTNFTIQTKRFKGQRSDHVTLKDTGDFYNSFTIVFTNTGFFINATDEKTQQLIGKYGREILGLTESNIVLFTKFAYLKLMIKLRKKISFD